MNLPNKLTVSRFALTVVFLWALFWPWPIPFRGTLALFFFGLAGSTDYLDGRIARSRGLITNFGILMDPLADKVMTCSAFIAFVESTRLNPVAPEINQARQGGQGNRHPKHDFRKDDHPWCENALQPQRPFVTGIHDQQRIDGHDLRDGLVFSESFGGQHDVF